MQPDSTQKNNIEHTENERLRFALQAAGIGTWDLDPIHNKVMWDERCRELFGFAPKEVVSYEEVLKYMHPDDAIMVNIAVQKALDPATEDGYEVRYRIVADGRVCWVLSKGKAYFNDKGIAWRFAGTAQDITKSILDSEKVAASEKMAQMALENSNSGYFHLLLDSNQLEYSSGYVRILTGTERMDMKHTDFVKYVHPEDLHKRDIAFKNAETTGTFEYDARTIWNDGSIHWMRARGTYLNDTSGKPYLLSGTIHDITAEHLHKESIRQAEDLLSAAFDNASVGMAFTDLLGRCIKANEAFAAIVGYTAAQFCNEDYLDIIHPDDKGKNGTLFSELVYGKRQFYNLTKRYRHKDGFYKWVQVNVTSVAGNANRAGRIMVIARDIDTDIQKEKALASIQAMLRNVSDSAPTGLWLSDEDGLLTYLNKTLADWTGMPYQELLGAGWANAIIEEDRERGAQAFLAAIAARAHYDVQFRITKGTGEVIWCHAAGDPYYHEDGSYAGYAGFCMDIQELLTGRQEITESEARFRSLIEEAPIATCLFVGRELKIELANSIMIGYWGKGNSAINKPLADALPELAGQPFLHILDDIFTTGQAYEQKAAPVDLVVNGVLTTTYFDYTYKPLFDAKGQVYAIMNMAVDVTEEVMSRRRLEESELFSRSIFYNSPVAKVVFTGADMVITTVNEKMLEILGRDASIVGKPFIEAVPELTPTPLMDRLRNVLATGETYYQPEEQIQLIKDGKPHIGFYNYIYKALHNTQGAIYGVMVTATDVSEQVTDRKKLEENELYIRSIFYNSPVAKMVFTGPDMVISTINENMFTMLGRDASIVGMPFMEAMPELIPTPLMNHLKHVRATGETFTQAEEKISFQRYGQPHSGYYTYIYKPLYNLAGEIYGIMCTCSEITEQVLARQKIEETKESLRGAIELAELATWSIDGATYVLTSSERMQSWFGFNDDETIYTTGYNPVHEKDREQVNAAITYALMPESGGIYDQEYTVVAYKTGLERICHAQGKTIFDTDGRPLVLSGTAQDITIQRQAQLALELEVQVRTEELAATNEEIAATNEELATTNEELEESNEQLMHSNEELAQYAYVASHDLQEPLRKIRIFTARLQDQAGISEEGRGFVEKIAKSAERMSLLILNLLDFSRLLKSDSLMVSVNLREVANAIADDFELAIHDNGAAINIGDMPVIEAVALQMNQLLYNLVGNALKFTKPGVPPVISISSAPVSTQEAGQYISRPSQSVQYYRISVTDNGIGFDEEYAEQIFEVFKRLHGRDLYQGSGIGLALCRRIVVNHGGAVYAQSQKGIGSEFHIILPEKQK